MAYEVLFKSENWDRGSIIDWRLDAARATGQLSRPLRDFEGDGVQTSSKSVGYLAVTLLVRSVPTGASSLRTLCEEVGAGSSLPNAFEAAFSISLDDFYAAFETHREKLNSPVEHPAPTSTPMGTKLPAGPTNIYYDIADDVPVDQVQIITTGLQLAQDFLDGELGGGIPKEARSEITVKIVATGRGNEEPGGDGACCTAFGGTYPVSTMRPFFDLAHPDWNPGSRNRQLWTTVHEYAHIWQHHLGCISKFHQPLGNWLNEGIAQYVAFEAMTRTGQLTLNRPQVIDLLLSEAVSSGALSRPLQDFAEGAIRDIGIWPGNAGFLALHRIMPPAIAGIVSLRTVCQEVAAGASVPEAVETAFGMSLDDLYADFE